MTTSFFSAKTQYNPIHDAETISRPELTLAPPTGATAPLRRAASASKAGWFVSGIAALVGVATFSIVSFYAVQEFTKSPVPASTTAPSVAPDLAVATVAPAPPSTPAPSRKTDAPRVVVVPSHRSAPATSDVPASSPEVTTPPTPVAPPADPEPTTPTWPPTHDAPPQNCGIVRCDHVPPTPKDPPASGGVSTCDLVKCLPPTPK